MTSQAPKATPPVAKRQPVTDTRHGITRSDDYAWLRADNWQQVMRDPSVLAADIRDYLEAENAYLDSQMADTKPLQEQLFAEMKGRIKEDDSSVPALDGPYAYYSRFETGAQHPLYCRLPRDKALTDTNNEVDEQILIDANALAKPHAYFRLGGIAHSPDHSLLAYAADVKGSEYYTIHIKRLADGVVLDHVIEDTGGGMVWAADNRTLFYTRMDDNHRPKWVYARDVLAGPDSEQLVYEEKDPGFFVGVGETQSRAFVTINAHDHTTSEVWLIPTADPLAAPRCVSPRQPDLEYDVEHQGDRLLILTNADGAEDFKLVSAPLATPDRAHWSDLVPHQQGRLILSHLALKDHLIRMERENGLPRLVIHRLADGDERAIAFDEEAYSLGLSPGYEYDTTQLRFTYSSMTTPAQIIDYDIISEERIVRKTQEVPSGHDPDAYVTRRLMAPAHDGELVPITLLYRKTTPLDGQAPLLLYGYGAYGISIPAAFSTNILSLVDRGFVYAIAHIRGGKEKGYAWYRDGKGAHKVNTFKDFIASAQYLVEQGFTRRGRIFAHGGSAGGMLMGAVANMAPALWGGIIAEVPFVDVLNTMLDDSLPLTPPEWPEWGNPIIDAEAYATIASYSPYDNVTAQAYPPLLAVGGLTDPRVTYWEPAKWVAKLRAHATNDALLLLKTNMEAGHGGASGRFDRLKETALNYAFALKLAADAAERSV